jgi:hypothetical protein
LAQSFQNVIIPALHHGIRIIARQLENGSWQARDEKTGILTAFHSTPSAAIDEARLHIDAAFGLFRTRNPASFS